MAENQNIPPNVDNGGENANAKVLPNLGADPNTGLQNQNNNTPPNGNVNIPPNVDNKRNGSSIKFIGVGTFSGADFRVKGGDVVEVSDKKYLAKLLASGLFQKA